MKKMICDIIDGTDFQSFTGAEIKQAFIKCLNARFIVPTDNYDGRKRIDYAPWLGREIPFMISLDINRKLLIKSYIEKYRLTPRRLYPRVLYHLDDFSDYRKSVRAASASLSASFNRFANEITMRLGIDRPAMWR
jgi:hypothetical protein